MPDSEHARQDAKKAAKPTKKTAKKATVKKAAPAKPAQESVDSAAALERVGETLDAVIAEARAQGIPALSGGATVRLVMNVDGAATPVDAVERFIATCANEGLRRWTYVITDDETGENFVVNGGVIVQLEDDGGSGG